MTGCGCGWLADEWTKRSIASKLSSASLRESAILRKCSYTNLPRAHGNNALMLLLPASDVDTDGLHTETHSFRAAVGGRQM
jgi:hypothetical protein